ncbi:MAG: putative sensor domain DACNV-containing protein [Vicinamibacterales bacterium]
MAIIYTNTTVSGSTHFPAYPAARAVAPVIEAHFARHIASAITSGQAGLSVAPAARDIETVIDAAFWASLRREEGLTPTISLALLPASSAGQAMTFARPLALRPASLAKLAPAVERPGIHLGVWHDDGHLVVWGTTRAIPPYCFVLEVIGSGLLVVKHRSDPFGKFVNIAVLEGDDIKIIDDAASAVPDCPGLVKSLLGQWRNEREGDRVSVIVQLAASMRAHHKGGALLVVPDGSAHWRESIVEPILYDVEPDYPELAQLLEQPESTRRTLEWREELRRAVDAVAGLTAVDGATVMTRSGHVLAFGAKIERRRKHPSVDRVLVSEPIEGRTLQSVHPSQLGGTRHLSAAQFAQDQPDALALVASQDGRFTVFTWSPCDHVVHAHRIEALLL